MKKTGKVETFERPAYGDGRMYVRTGASYEVASWIPKGESKPTEVHVIIPIGPNASAVMCLASTDSIDTLVGILLAQRAEVWGPKGGKPS